MKAIWILALAFAPALVHAKLNVVATLPDFGSIAEAVGGEHVKVTTIARGSEDPHFVDARPSFIRVLNQADVLIEGGADLEIGWLPRLVEGARNAKILTDAPGHLVLGRFVKLLEVPTAPVDRSMGDVHPSGNPHFWLDPNNGRIIAQQIADTFRKADPLHAADYTAHAAAFTEKLEGKIKQWTEALASCRGTKILTYHKSFDYFTQLFGLESAGQLERKPGIEPSAAHINALVPRARQEQVRLVIIEPFRPRRTAEQVAGAIGAKLLILPDKVGATERDKDYFQLFDHLTSAIAEALGSPK
jgi:zinc/manganese transport system substrate-binding protein